jgi:outer membrane receptor protein involved in Fe transport
LIQEVRLLSTWQKPIDYIVGLYYQAQQFNFEAKTLEPGYTQYVTAINGTGLPRPNGDLQYDLPMDSNGFSFQDRAIFGELTWHITPQWQATGGVRFFHQDFKSLGEAVDYYFVGTGALDYNIVNHSKVSDHILKLNTSYNFAPDQKLYVTYSEGFRRGGANALPVSGAFASQPQLLSFSPDKSKNYEIGVKGELFDRRLRYTADIFLIKWPNFQFNSFSGSAYPAVLNGTEAQSKGSELQMEFQVTRQLSGGLSYAYTEAKVLRGFTANDYAPGALLGPSPPQTIPVATIQTDARLPGTSKHSANATLNYTIPLGDAAVVLHGDVAYRSSAPAYIDPTSPFYWEIPSWVLVNSRITYDSGRNWAADMFVNNVTNRTIYSGGSGTLLTQPNLFQERYVGRPRTYGLGLHYKW